MKQEQQYTTVRGPGFEMRMPATMENNLEQLTLASKIREKTPQDLHTHYPKFSQDVIKQMFYTYLEEAKELRGISCIKTLKAYSSVSENIIITHAMPEFIHAYVKQTQYARLKTEEKLLLYS